MDNLLLRDAIKLLRERLPAGWRVERKQPGRPTSIRTTDAAATFTDPNGLKGTLLIEGRARVYPKDVLELGAGTPKNTDGSHLLVVSPFLSKSTRQALREASLNWLDLTGNVRLVLRRPGLFIETEGAKQRIGGGKGQARTLKGQNAGRVVRALLTADLPIGVVGLAQRAGTDPGYASRVLKLLENEALIERIRRGPVTRVDRAKLAHRWAEDAPLASRARIEAYFEPRGLGALKDKLRGTKLKYAVTGSLAAQQWSPIAAPRLGQVYVSDPEEAAEALDLRPAGGAVNVQLLRPRDHGILESARKGQDNVYYARPLQVVLDLLAGPGRSPSEGEELLAWMASRPDAWD